MPDRFIESHINRIPIFQNLPQDQLQLLASAFEAHRYHASEIIFQQGAPSQGLYILIEGTGVLTQIGPDGVERTIAAVRPNQFLNQEALLADSEETATLRAQTEITVLFLSRPRLMTLVAHHPELKVSLGLVRSKSHHSDQVRFKGQREDERVILVTRRHWWAYMRMAWLPIVLFLLLSGAALLVPDGLLTTALFAIAVFFPGILMLYFYFEWRNDSIIITDQRVIRITHTILSFKETINEMPIFSIHEVNAEYPSADPFARLFNYGTIQVRTSGEAGNFELALIPRPTEFQRILLEDRNLLTERESIQHRNAMRAELDRWISSDPGQAAMQSEQKSNKGGPTKPRMRPFRMKYQLSNGDMVYRRHIMVWIRHLIPPTLFVIAAVAMLVLDLFNPIFQSLGILSWIATFFVFLVGAAWFYWAYWDWSNDYYIIGATTITANHERPLFLQSENEQMLLSRVDNVEAETTGFLRQVFNYGDLRVSLTGADEPKVFESIPTPRLVQEDISRRRAKIGQRQSENAAQQQRQIIGEYLSMYHQMTHQGQPMPEQAPQYQPPYPGQSHVPQTGYPGNQPGPSPQGQYPPNIPAANLPGQPQQGNYPAQSMPPTQPPPTAAPRDRSRPPNIPQQRRPYLSPGRPYQPPANDPTQPNQDFNNPRPPMVPRARPPHDDNQP